MNRVTANQTETAAPPACPVLAPGQVVQIPVGMLQPDPNQPRTEFDEAALKALAADIGARGIELPIVVRGDYTIKDGERRWRAAKMANLAAVPCLLASTNVEGEGEFAVHWKLDQVADNHHREALSPMDWSRFLHDLVERHGIAVKDVPALLAKRGITMSRPYCSNLIRLVELPEWAANLVKTGQLTAAHGKHILAAKDSPAALEALREAILDWLSADYNGPLTVDDLQHLVEHAFAEVHIRLDRTWGDDAPRFNVATCKGCASRKVLGREENSNVFCLDQACFNKKQSEAPPLKTNTGSVAGIRRASDPSKTAATRRREQARKIAQRRAIKAIVATADGSLSLDDLRLVADAVLDWHNMREIAERRGWELKETSNVRAVFEKQIASMTAKELHGLIIEAAITPPHITNGRELAATAKRHKIDLKALEKTARAELKKPAKKKTAKKGAA